MVDSIASGLSYEFVDKIKKQLIYEIRLVLNLEIKSNLGLMFDLAEVQSKLLKLLQVYA